MPTERDRLLSRLDAEAELLARGRDSGLEARVRDAALRCHRRVDWALWPAQYANEAADSEGWVYRTLSSEVARHRTSARPSVAAPPIGSPELQVVVTDVAELWNRLGVNFIPDAVNARLNYSLSALGWSQERIERERVAMIAAVRRHRVSVKKPSAKLQAARVRVEAAIDQRLEREAAARATESERRVQLEAAQAHEVERVRAEQAAARERAELRLRAEAEQHERELQEARDRRERERAREERERQKHARAEADARAAAQAEAERERAREERERQKRVLAEAEAQAEAERERQERWLRRPAPAPDPQPFGVSHEGAEHLVAMWLRHFGVPDAEVTKFSGDGGVDVTSASYVAQVKNLAGSVPVQDIRALHGVAVADGKRALLFTSGSVTNEGLAFAGRVSMPLLRYNAVEGTIAGLNSLGERVVEYSVAEAWGGTAVGSVAEATPDKVDTAPLF